jgi:hypothetical protein
MLLSKDNSEKSVKVASGGEQRRLMFGKLTLQEPTNHLDMESIEALNLALENNPGTCDQHLRPAPACAGPGGEEPRSLGSDSSR